MGRNSKRKSNLATNQKSEFNTKLAPDPFDDLEIFLGILCVEWGFCVHLKAENLLKPDKTCETGQVSS